MLSNAPTVPDAARRADVDLLLRRTYTYSPIDAAVLCHEVPPLLRENGIRVEVDGDGDRFRAAQGEPDITPDRRRGGRQRLVQPAPAGGGRRVVVPMDRLIVELNSSATHMLLDDGTYFPLDHPALQRLTELLDEAKALGEIEGSRVRRDSYNATLWEELLSPQGVVDGDLAQWQQRMARLASASPPQHHEPPTAPAGATARLPGRWLQLADVPVGTTRSAGSSPTIWAWATVQALSLMAYALESDPELRFLVIAPTSVVGNWVREAEKFCRRRALLLSSLRTDGPIDEQIDDARIVVTSYTLFRLQFAAFDEYDWAAVLFDEAQFIKNHNGKTTSVRGGSTRA